MNEKYMNYLVLLLNRKNNTMYCPPPPLRLSLLNLVVSTFRDNLLDCNHWEALGKFWFVLFGVDPLIFISSLVLTILS